MHEVLGSEEIRDSINFSAAAEEVARMRNTKYYCLGI